MSENNLALIGCWTDRQTLDNTNPHASQRASSPGKPGANSFEGSPCHRLFPASQGGKAALMIYDVRSDDMYPS